MPHLNPPTYSPTHWRVKINALEQHCNNIVYHLWLQHPPHHNQYPIKSDNDGLGDTFRPGKAANNCSTPMMMMMMLNKHRINTWTCIPNFSSIVYKIPVPARNRNSIRSPPLLVATLRISWTKANFISANCKCVNCVGCCVQSPRRQTLWLSHGESTPLCHLYFQDRVTHKGTIET